MNRGLIQERQREEREVSPCYAATPATKLGRAPKICRLVADVATVARSRAAKVTKQPGPFLGFKRSAQAGGRISA